MIERTKDYRIVKRLVEWPVIISRKCFYLLEKVGDEIRGLWAFEPYMGGVRIHADMGKKCRGRDAVLSAKFSFDWIFRHTQFKSIHAGIPVGNRQACLIASRSGMHLMETNEKLRWYKLSKGW